MVIKYCVSPRLCCTVHLSEVSVLGISSDKVILPESTKPFPLGGSSAVGRHVHDADRLLALETG